MKLHWLPAASDDIHRLYQFLLDKIPLAAAAAIETILKGSEILTTMPEIGLPMNDDTER